MNKIDLMNQPKVGGYSAVEYLDERRDAVPRWDLSVPIDGFNYPVTEVQGDFAFARVYGRVGPNILQWKVAVPIGNVTFPTDKW